MGKNDKTGRNLKFYLQPADEFKFNEAMQKDGFSARGPYLTFLVGQRGGMSRAAIIFAAWTKYVNAKAEFERLIQTEPL